MEGVRILATNTTQVYLWVALIIALVIGLFTGLIIGVKDDFPAGLYCGFIVFVLAFCIIYFPNRKPTTIYDVIVDDTISWTEFNEKYEVIDQNGEIIKVKLKEE